MTFDIKARSLTLFREETKNTAGETVAFWAGRIQNALPTEDGRAVDIQVSGRGLRAVMGDIKPLIVKTGKTADKAKPYMYLGLVDIEAEPDGGIEPFDRADGSQGFSQRVYITHIARAVDKSTEELDAMMAGV